MTSYLGVPVSSKQASTEFATIGQNYKKASYIKDLGIKLCRPLITFYYIGFLSMASWLIKANALAGNLIPVTQPIGNKILASFSTLFEPVSYVVFVTEKPLTEDQMKELKISEKTPGGKFKHGYITTSKIRISQAAGIVESLKKIGAKLEPAQGIQGTGLTVNACKSLLNLGRLVRAFISSQSSASNINEGSPGTSYFEFGTFQNNGEDPDATDIPIPKKDVETFLAPSPSQFDEDSWYEFIYTKTAYTFESVCRTVDDADESPAHLFKFVPGTIPADQEFFGTLIYNQFSHLFSDKSEVAKTLIEALVGPIKVVAAVPEGSALLFLLLVSSFAIQCGGRIRPILSDGQLLGAALYTGQFMWRGDVLVKPVDADAIRSTLSSWLTVSKARKVVADYLSEMAVLVGKVDKVIVRVQDIDMVHKLAKEIAKRSLPAFLSSDVMEALPYLGYPTVDISATATEIEALLDRLASGSYPGIFTVTPYLFTLRDQVLVANLSIFGERSISFNNTGGKALEIFKDAKEDPNLKKTKKIIEQVATTGKKGTKAYKNKEVEVPFWDRICVYRTDIKTAYEDFESFRNTGKIHQITVYDSRAYGNIDIHPLKKTGDTFMEALRVFGKSESFFAERRKQIVPIVPVAEVEGAVDEDKFEEELDF